MLVPYNVDRVTRRVPLVTYALMVANISCFLFSVAISNFSLSEDRDEGRKSIAALVPDAQTGFDISPEIGEEGASGSSEEGTQRIGRAQMSGVDASGAPDASRQGQADDAQASERMEEMMREVRQMRAMQLASKRITTLEGYKQFWQIEHAYDGFVLEPHWSVLNSFAYHVAGTGPLSRFGSMFSSMFVHADIDHLFGNMLFLWVFGRAAEEFLGRKFYLSTYFLAGIGASLLDHIMTTAFAPQGAGIPSMGASGAIAGVLGLFAVRFYRTKVRVFYLFGWGLIAFFIVGGIAAALVGGIIGDPIAGLAVGLATAAALLYFVGRGSVWGAFRAPSVWVIGVWVVVLNLAPAILKVFSQEIGGVAYWAHLGGFALGAAYALAIGGVADGKTEYQIEDAHEALQTQSSDAALGHASAVLQKDANNPQAHEVAARAYDRRKNLELAAGHYNRAIEGFWRANDRDAAVRAYGIAMECHPNLPVRASLLLSLASHYGGLAMWPQAAGVLVRLVEENPGTPEAEIALLRSAQLWMRQFRDGAEAARQLELFLQMHPDSQWRQQAQDALQAARRMTSDGV